MRAVLRRLRKAYPEARTALNFETPWQLLVATILSAQTTDVQVNEVTPALFARWPGPVELAGADEAEVVKIIFATGFHNQKARSIIGTARAVAERHGGKVPRRMEQMVQLPGVGRKTASVVLGNAYGSAQGIAVDTHVRRLVRRLGFTTDEDPVKIEQVLLRLVPRPTWTLFTHLFIAHGRAVCIARAPRCPDCVLLSLCPDGQERLGLSRARAARASSTSPASAGSPASG